MPSVGNAFFGVYDMLNVIEEQSTSLLRINYKAYDHVEVDDGVNEVFTGRIVGLVSPMIIDVFIIELDRPRENYDFSCVTAFYDQMKLIIEE
jgi:hypothetical protein